MTNHSNNLFQKHKTLLDDVKLFTDETLSPAAQEYDKFGRFPAEFLPFFFEKNVFHLLSSPSSLDVAAFLEIIRTVSTKFASLASILLTQGFYAVSPFFHFGTVGQKERYLGELLEGKCFGGFGLTEGHGGSSFPALETTAFETENGWILEGTKQYVSNATVADVFLIAAKAQKLNGENGLALFIVERATPGFAVAKPMDKIGIRSLPVASVQLNKVKISKEALLGGALKGEDQVRHIMNAMKLSVSMQALGLSQGAVEKGLYYLKLVRKFGNRLIDSTSTQDMLADITTQIHAAEAFTRQVILSQSQESTEVARVKLLTANTAIETTETMIQLTGGYGYMKDSEIERYVRDAKVTAIYGGSSNSQKRLIAESWLTK